MDTIEEKFNEIINGNGNGNGNGKGEKETSKPTEYIQKISNVIGHPEYKLVESVLINGISKLLISDGTDIKIANSIELEDKILKPFAPSSYMNIPYSFDSEEQVQQYIEKSKTETLDTLYNDVKPVWKKYIHADDFHITICSADTIFTYLQDKIGLTHYLFFVGSSTAGKSNNLTVFQYLAYRNMTSTGLSYANIYQFLGSGEEGIGTICEDEADNIDIDPEKMKIYKNGYTTGRPTAKTDLSFGRKQYKYNNFCFKAFSAEGLPDVVKAQGFNQRIIEIHCAFGIPEFDISEVVNPAGEQEFQGLLDELLDIRNRSLMYRLRKYAEPIPNIKLNIVNREKQLFKPIIRVFQGTETLKELLPVISKYVSDKRQKNTNSYHASIYNILKDLLYEEGFEIESMKVVNKIIAELECEPVPAKPQSYIHSEFGYLSNKSIIQTLQDVFGAKKLPSHKQSRKIMFDKDTLDNLSKLYEIKVDIQVVEGSGTGDTLDALDASSKDVSQYSDIDTNHNEQENNEDIDQNEANEIVAYTNNVSQASQASPTSPSNDDGLRYPEAKTEEQAVKAWNATHGPDEQVGNSLQ